MTPTGHTGAVRHWRVSFPWCSTNHMERSLSATKQVRIAGISAVAGLFAPLVFVSIIILRKVNRRTKSYTRRWNKRLQNEISRWS
jgi:hypothetical protein